MTLFMYAYTPPEGEIWTDEAVAQLVGKSPTVTGLTGRYAAGEIVAAQRRGPWPDREIHVTVSMPDDVLLPLPDDYEEGELSSERTIEDVERIAAERWVSRAEKETGAQEIAAAAQPHSRACGIAAHPHGLRCASDCPTCLPGMPRPPSLPERRVGVEAQLLDMVAMLLQVADDWHMAPGARDAAIAEIRTRFMALTEEIGR